MHAIYRNFHLFIFADFDLFFSLFLETTNNLYFIPTVSQYEEVGIGLVGFSILFSFLGVILFFDRGLLALGNV
jgi:hypothetical protein